MHGKPQSDAEITILLPDGTQKKVKTKQDGRTEVLSDSGRYGAWARYWEPVGGERDGKKYVETRNYATLVLMRNSRRPPHRLRLAFWAEACACYNGQTFRNASRSDVKFRRGSERWLAVRIRRPHCTYPFLRSTAAVSGLFERLNLTDGKWEALPGGPACRE